MKIECRSFGFKNGADAHADFVFDVRCLPNPFYIEQLKYKTGLDKPVRDYVLNSSQSRDYLKKIVETLLVVIPIKEQYGIEKMAVSFGCTGGHHRSVFMAHALAEYLNKQGLSASEFHRDIGI